MICTALGVCKSKEQLKKLRNNGEGCDICKLVVTYLKNMLKDNTTDVSDFEYQVKYSEIHAEEGI